MSTHRAEEYANKLTRHAVHWVDKMYTHRMCLEGLPQLSWYHLAAKT
jgi:hypothetical protein